MSAGFRIVTASLLTGLAPLTAPLAQPLGEIPPVCADIARLASEEDLGQAIVRAGGTLAYQSDGGLMIGRLDFDADGRIESAYERDGLVFLVDDNEQPIEISPDPTVDWGSDDFRWPTPFGIVTRDGRSHIVWWDGVSLSYASEITRALVHRVACQFGQRDEPARTVVSGYEAVCAAAAAGTMSPVSFDHLHAVTSLGRRETSPSPRAARVDVDNDGTQDLVIQTLYSSGRGQGCGINGLAILDDARTGLAVHESALLVDGAVDTCGDILTPVTFEGRTYLEQRRFGTRRRDSLLKVENGERLEVCAILVAAGYYVLTDYERFQRAAEQAYVSSPWEYAFRQPGVAAAELLLANGHSIDETVRDQPLLMMAMGQGRTDLFEWLLARGADPEKGDTDEPYRLLERAVRIGQLEMATRLVEAGVDPAPIQYEIIDSIDRGVDGMGPFVLAVVTRLGHVPELILQQAVRSQVPWLDELTGSRLPVQLAQIEWRSGRRSIVPFWVAGELGANRAELRKVANMFERTQPPATRFAVAVYGTYENGWQLQRGIDSPVSDEQLLTFATSVCVYFLEADCGPPELVRSAREWAESLNLACDDPRLAGSVDAVACSVGMYYASVANVEYLKSIVIVPINEQQRTVGSPILNRGDLRDLYVAKRARQ